MFQKVIVNPFPVDTKTPAKARKGNEMEAMLMKIKVFPARVKKLSKTKTAKIEKALLSAPKAPIAKLHEEARQFESMMLARRSIKI